MVPTPGQRGDHVRLPPPAAEHGATPRWRQAGRDFSRTPTHAGAPRPLQAKLTVATPGDAHEQAADRAADQVTGRLQGRERLLPRRAQSPGGEQTTAPPIIQRVLAQPGQALEPATRRFMESRLGHDFSRVRVHTGELAAQSAEAVAAEAYTVGSQVVFGPGRYAPGSPAGRRLLAHELAHVVQQAEDEIVARKPDEKKTPKTPAKPRTKFHPGVKHDHQPSGRWADVQNDPKSPGIVGFWCSHFAPENVMRSASLRMLYDKPIATDHLKWYFKGGGKDFVEDANLDLMLRTDAGVQKKIASKVPSDQTKGTFTGDVTITQDNYADEDFQFAFGEIDRLDLEIDFDAKTFHAWFQDRYEWHPVYPFYKQQEGDYLRDTNCVHAAAVELKSSGAKDFWMKGEATVPLKAVQSAASRNDPMTDPPLPGL